MRGWSVTAALVVLGAGSVRGQDPRLISTAELVNLVDSVPVHLIDVRFSWVSYLQNHLPNAAWLNVETLRAQDRELPFQLLSGEQYAEVFRRLELSPDGPIVIYSAGDQADVDATFAAWLLASAGATRVYLLDGGYAKWDLEGRPLSQGYPRWSMAAGPFLPSRFRAAVASLDEVKAAIDGSGALLVDARPAEQYSGRAGAQLRRGHIPGAVNHPWRDDLDQPDLALVWRTVDELRSRYLAQGITPDRDIILYCNSGTEASHVFFALRYLLGYPAVRIFTGSWTQWSEREDLPVER